MNIAERKKVLEGIWRFYDTSKIGYQVVDLSPRRNPITEKESVEQPQKLLEAQIQDIERNHAYSGHYLPKLVPYSFFHIIQTAFGGRIMWADDNTPPWGEPVITALDGSISNIITPTLQDGCIPEVFEWIRYFLANNKNNYVLRAVNLQSPIANVAELVGDESFLMSLYDIPEQIKHLLRITAQLMIEIINKEIEQIGAGNFTNIYSYPDWIPPGYGVGIADDYLAVISSEMYREFAIDCNNMLSRAFNGIFLHSCGNVEDKLDVLHEHYNFRGLNFEAGDNDVAAIVESFSGRAVIAPHPGLKCREKFGGLAGYVDAFITAKKPDTAMILTIETYTYNPATGVYEEDATLGEAVKILETFNKTTSLLPR